MVPGGHYHLMNRGNNRATVFHDADDYRRFLGLMAEAQERRPLRLLAACLMPNHFHLVAAQMGGGDLSRWMQWLLTSHTHAHHGRMRSSGRLWQGRFKAFPIQHDGHLVAVIRYVERNALRAGLVARAEDWPWGSLAWRLGTASGPALAAPPCPLPAHWPDIVNRPQSADELAALRACANRQRPYGSDAWTREYVERLGLESSVRPVGRPPNRASLIAAAGQVDEQ